MISALLDVSGWCCRGGFVGWGSGAGYVGCCCRCRLASSVAVLGSRRGFAASVGVAGRPCRVGRGPTVGSGGGGSGTAGARPRPRSGTGHGGAWSAEGGVVVPSGAVGGAGAVAARAASCGRGEGAGRCGGAGMPDGGSGLGSRPLGAVGRGGAVATGGRHGRSLAVCASPRRARHPRRPLVSGEPVTWRCVEAASLAVASTGGCHRVLPVRCRARVAEVRTTRLGGMTMWGVSPDAGIPASGSPTISISARRARRPSSSKS